MMTHNDETHKERQNDWVDSAMNSYRGRKTIPPPENLFEKIEEQIDAGNQTSMKLSWYVPIAAAIVLVVVNMTAVVQYSEISKNTVQQSAENYLITDYNLYDYE